MIEKRTPVRRSAFSPRSVSRIFTCCSVDSAAGAPAFVSPPAALGAAPCFGACEGCAAPPCPVVSGLEPTDFSGACALRAGFALSGACALGFAFSGACAPEAGFAFSGACALGTGLTLSGACAPGAGFAFSCGACALGAGFSLSGFCGAPPYCWSVFPSGAFCAAAGGASRRSCADAKPAPATSAATAAVTNKVFLMVFS